MMKKHEILIGDGEKAVRTLLAAILDVQDYYIDLAVNEYEIILHLKKQLTISISAHYHNHE